MPPVRRRRRRRSSHLLRRTVCVSQKCPPGFPQILNNFPSNKIITSKYTLWNFLPKNLFEQFRRIANFYFLCIAVVQLSIRSPVSPATSMMPLMFVVTVTAIKQAYEDWLRHKADNIANHKPVTVYRNGVLVRVRSEDVKVGDVVRVEADEESPCDLVLLSSAKDNGSCQITTANLDGETNLKVHKCSDHTIEYKTEESLSELCAVIECGPPTPNLYLFNGKITVYTASGETKVSPLNHENLLLRGATLKNTSFVFGCAIFTGPETKMVLNLKITSNKFSTLERTLNRVLVSFLFIMLIEATITTSLFFTYNKSPLIGEAWYIPEESSVSAAFVLEIFLSFAVLFNYIIPISLYVTLELVKFIGAKFFVWDLQLYDETMDEPAVCNSSDLNEELGQVQCLFSDKTGTLTENCMEFRQCCVNGVNYEERNGQLCPVNEETVAPNVLAHFLFVLVLCNTVEIQRASDVDDQDASASTVQYFASSPDEKALVEACARFNVILWNISGTKYEIKTPHGTSFFNRLCTLEFTSERKRMSVIVEDPKGNIYLYCKGADVAVLDRVKKHNRQKIQDQINSYSLAGLRALAVAERQLTREEYEMFEKDLLNARCQLTNRDAKVAQVFDDFERNLNVIGATAVEDQLQKGVPATLEALRIAGIKIWVLTGDHNETAFNISLACGHIKREMIKLEILHQQNSDECFFSLTRLQMRIEDEMHNNYALVIDGMSLSFALDDHAELFKLVAEQCVSVLCCRMSPLQKAQVVKLIKNSATRPVTAAIGDGANDVSMIQEAHVGLGIIGKEGRQAVRCSDFAFSQFRFLRRVFLVHGQYYYVRASTLVQYFFYKNVAFIVPQFIYIFYNGYTPQPIYNSVFLMLYNIFFTSLPIFVYGFTEKHKDEETLLSNPSLYRTLSKNSYLKPFEFVKWVAFGLWHCLVLFYGVFFIWQDSFVKENSALVLGMWTFGTVIFHILVVIANLKLGLHAKHWTWLFTGSVIVTIVGFMGFTMMYTGIYWSVKTSTLYGVYLMALSAGQVWFLTFLLVVIALLPDVIAVVFEHRSFRLRWIWNYVHSHMHRPHRYFRFTFSKHADQPVMNASQINIIRSSLESEFQEQSG